MNKDITEDILLKAGFINTIDGTFKLYLNDESIILHYNHPPFGRRWKCSINNTIDMCIADIQTIEHFNKIMELMDIEFRLK